MSLRREAHFSIIHFSSSQFQFVPLYLKSIYYIQKILKQKRLVLRGVFCFNIFVALFFVNNINSRFNFEN